MNKKELMKHVKNRTEIGEAYAIMELNFLRWMAKKGLEKEACKK